MSIMTRQNKKDFIFYKLNKLKWKVSILILKCTVNTIVVAGKNHL